MTPYTADVGWALKDGEDFRRGRYSRGYSVCFDGGVELAGSASPHVVGEWADASAVDPEEMLVAALSGCHMLVFLHLAREAGFVVSTYRDHAEGLMSEIAPGPSGASRQAVTKVTLHPQIEWIGDPPGQEDIDRLHHASHEGCFIANSVKTEVTVARGGIAP